MKKRVNNVKKEDKYKEFDLNKLRKAEMIISLIVGIIFLVLLGFAVTNTVFIPAAMISFALFLFCICYYYLEDESKKKLVYVLFILGVLLIIIEVIYTLVKIYQWQMTDRDYLVILYDFYGELLTDKQKEYFEYYYFNNLSLSEISENLGISRNAIHKSIKLIESKLYFYEDKLKLYKKRIILRQLIKNLDDSIKEKLEELY